MNYSTDEPMVTSVAALSTHIQQSWCFGKWEGPRGHRTPEATEHPFLLGP